MQAYISAMPGWKRDVGAHLDAIITCVVPHVQKAGRWNTPLYGVEGQGWFLGFHCFTKYIKVSFLNGKPLQPMPPIAANSGDARHLHLQGGEPFDDRRFAAWIQQAAEKPGQDVF